MKTHKLVNGVILTCGALVSGFATLVFLVWLYPAAVPGAHAVPLQGVSIQGLHLGRTGMLVCLVLFGIATISLIGLGLRTICSRSHDA